MSRSRARLAADWFAKLRENAVTQEVEHTDVVDVAVAEASSVQSNDSPTFGTVTATSFVGDGSALTGISTPPTPSFQFISKAISSNATEIIFTGFNSSLYDSYQFTIAGITPSLYNRYFGIQFSTNGGSTWVGNENLFAFNLGANGLSMSLGVIGAHLNRPTVTTKLGVATTNTGAIYSFQGAYPFGVSGVNNAIKFMMSAGTIISGEITMYGLRKS